MIRLIRRILTLHPALFLLIVLLPAVTMAALTKHTESTLNALLLALDSNGNGSITDESWYQIIAGKLSASDINTEEKLENVANTQIATEAEAQGYVVTHEGSADPHPVYQLKSEMATAVPANETDPQVGQLQAGGVCYSPDGQVITCNQHYPFIRERTISDPADADDFFWFRAPANLTLASFNCMAEGTSPSITVDLQECDSNGDNCASVLSAPVTANGGNDAGTISDAAVASGAWMRVPLGTPTGTVTAISFTLAGTR